MRLGAKVRDTITGYAGTVTSVAHYLDRASRAQVTPNVWEARSEWFDFGRLEELDD